MFSGGEGGGGGDVEASNWSAHYPVWGAILYETTGDFTQEN